MLNALIYLRFTSFRNWLISRGRRLRQPKYLLGAVVGCAYFYVFFFRHYRGGPAKSIPPGVTPEALRALESASAALAVNWLPATTALGAIALLVFITFMWVVPTQRAALGFSEAEIAFLFPAPISRRGLVHFRLLSAQFRSLIGAAVMMLFSNRWTVLGGSPLTHAVGWWFIFSALNLHFSGANFTLTRLNDLGLQPWRRRLLVLAIIAALFAVSIARLPAGTPAPSLLAETDLRPAADWVVALTRTAPLRWLLLPFKLVLGPFLAVDLRSFLIALAPALAVVTLHYLWVVRTAVAFEDASLDYAQKRSARIAAWRSGQRRIGSTSSRGRPAPFRLADRGRPELAFLWKNLLSTWQYFSVRTLLVGAAVIIAGCLWTNAHPVGRGLLPSAGILALFFGAYTLIVGPQFARQDIRGDLVNADILKTYPLAGWQIIIGQLLTPIAILSGILWLVLLVIVLTFPAQSAPWLTPSLRIVGALASASIVPVLVTLQLLVPNAAALLFPAWFQLSRTRGGGPEIIGQRLIFFFAQLLTMVFALLPAVTMAGLLGFIAWNLVNPMTAIAAATIATLLVLLAEVGCGLWWLGERFEKLDLSAELHT